MHVVRAVNINYLAGRHMSAHVNTEIVLFIIIIYFDFFLLFSRQNAADFKYKFKKRVIIRG
jgi:hypothetical protein